LKERKFKKIPLRRKIELFEIAKKRLGVGWTVREDIDALYREYYKLLEEEQKTQRGHITQIKILMEIIREVCCEIGGRGGEILEITE